MDERIIELQGNQTFLKNLFLDEMQKKVSLPIKRITSLSEIESSWGFFGECQNVVYVWEGNLEKTIHVPENCFLVVLGSIQKKIPCVRKKFQEVPPWEEEKQALSFLQSLPHQNFNPKKLVTLYGTDLGLLFFEYKKIQWLGVDEKVGYSIPTFFRLLQALQNKQENLFFYWFKQYEENPSFVVPFSAFLANFVSDWYAYALSDADDSKKWYGLNIIRPVVMKWGDLGIQEMMELACEGEEKGKTNLANNYLWFFCRWKLFWRKFTTDS